MFRNPVYKIYNKDLGLQMAKITLNIYVFKDKTTSFYGTLYSLLFGMSKGFLFEAIF